MENDKYYYLMLKDSFYETEDMVLLESMENGYLYSNILMKLYLLSLKDKGRLMYKDRIPYNTKMLANLTRHNPDVIDAAIKIFVEMGLIELLDNGAMFMLDIENFIGRSSTKADRQRKYDRRILGEKQKLLQDVVPSTEISKKSVRNLTENCKKSDEHIKTKSIKTKNINLKDNKPPLSPLEIFEGRSISDKMKSIITEWISYKQERKESYKPTGLKMFLSETENKIKQYGEDAVIYAFTASMANNWKGVIYEKAEKYKPDRIKSGTKNDKGQMFVDGEWVFV